MSVVSHSDLPSIRERHRDERIVFCSGSFDLAHAGHVLFLEDCKRLGDVLVVCVGNDALTRHAKGGGRPVLNQHLRLKMVDALKPVDYCLVDDTAEDKYPLEVLGTIFPELKPDSYVINEDAFDIPYRKAVSKRFGVRLLILPRTSPPEFDAVSTTGIIDKIKRLDGPKG